MSARDTEPQVFPEGEYLSFFIRASEALGQSLNYRQTLHSVAAVAAATIADICIVDVGDAGSTQMVAAAHRDPCRTAELRGIGSHLRSAAGHPIHPVCRVLKNQQTFYAPQIDEAWIAQHASSPEHAAFMRRMGFASMIVVPLVSQVFGVAGALTLVTTHDGHPPFHNRAVWFAQGLGRMCSSAIGKARLYEEVHATATTFQRAALPQQFPNAPGLEFFSFYEPAAKELLVGGDWYDAFRIPDGRIAICIGDVAGHGLHGAVLMASMRNALRTAIIMEPDIGRAFDSVDYLLRTEYPGTDFCTALLAIVDTDAMTLRLGSAGHPGPKIWDARAGRLTDPFMARDLPLGLRNLSTERATPKTIRLDQGLVVFYTDGLVECTRDALFGDRHLEEVLRRSDVHDAPDPARAVIEAMTECAEPRDDIAIFAARFSTS